MYTYSIHSRTGFHNRLDPVGPCRKSAWVGLAWGGCGLAEGVPAGGEGGWGQSPELTPSAFQGSSAVRWKAASTSSPRPWHLRPAALRKHQPPSLQHAAAPARAQTRAQKPRASWATSFPLPCWEKQHFVTPVNRQPLLFLESQGTENPGSIKWQYFCLHLLHTPTV